MILTSVIALGMSASVAAQPTVSVRGNVGASFFQSPELLGESLHSGVDLGAGVGVQIYRGVSLTVRGGLDRFTLNEQNFRRTGFEEGGDVSFLSGSIGLRYTYENETDAHPYLSTGVGRYQQNVSNRRTSQNGELVEQGGTRSDTALGSHLALGSLLRLNDTYALFFESRYVFYDVSESVTGAQRYFTLRLGVDVQFGEGDLF